MKNTEEQDTFIMFVMYKMPSFFLSFPTLDASSMDTAGNIIYRPN